MIGYQEVILHYPNPSRLWREKANGIMRPFPGRGRERAWVAVKVRRGDAGRSALAAGRRPGGRNPCREEFPVASGS
jgi:hypothetical protein